MVNLLFIICVWYCSLVKNVAMNGRKAILSAKRKGMLFSSKLSFPKLDNLSWYYVKKKYQLNRNFSI